LAWLEDAQPLFHESRPTRRQQWLANLVDVSCGLGSGGEARLEFGLQGFEEEGGLDETGIQDARLTFAWQFPDAGPVAVSGGLGVKLPNAPDDDRLGTDQTDVFLTGSVGQAKVRWGWSAEAGLGILGHPLEPGTQDDVLVFGAAGWWRAAGAPVSVIAEVEGTAASRFGNNRQTAGAGAVLGRSWPVALMWRHGLTEESPVWSIAVTVTFVPPESLR